MAPHDAWPGTNEPPHEAPSGTTGGPPDPSGADRLHRCRGGRMVAGVAAGVAHYFDVDPVLVRIGFVVCTLLGALAVPLYVAGWLLIPEEGSELSVAEELLSAEPVGPHRCAG